MINNRCNYVPDALRSALDSPPHGDSASSEASDLAYEVIGLLKSCLTSERRLLNDGGCHGL